MAGFGAYVDKTGGFDRDDFMASKEFKEAAKNDTVDAKLEPGELVIHPEIFKDKEGQVLLAQIMAKMMKEGANPLAYFAGSEMGQYDPTNPQGPQHFFFGKIFRGISRVFKKIVKSPIGRIAVTAAAAMAAPTILPALGVKVGAATGGISTLAAKSIGAGLGSAVATKAAGGTWGQALMSGAGSGLGSYVGGHMLGQTAAPAAADVAKGVTVNPTTGFVAGTTDLAGNVITTGGQQMGSTIANLGRMAAPDSLMRSASNFLGSNLGAVGRTIANANLGAIAGQSLGESVGLLAGSAMDPPRPAAEYFQNVPYQLPQRAMLPQSTLNLGLSAGNAQQYMNSNLSPATPYLAYQNQQAKTPGVDYYRSFLGKGGERESEKVGTFGNALYKADRGFSLGGRGGFGIMYY